LNVYYRLVNDKDYYHLLLDHAMIFSTSHPEGALNIPLQAAMPTC
jgi:hypothetical protein